MRQPALLLVLLAAAAACSDPIKLMWKLDVGAPSVSTPLVTDAFIAVGTETGLVIVEADGRKRCAFDAHGEVISAPKSDGKRIFFGSTNYIFYAVDTTCLEAWKFPTRDRIKSDPLVLDGRVVLTSYDGHVYAMDAAKGERIWTFPAADAAGSVGDFSYSSPIASEGVIYVGNLDGHLYALRAADGALLWRFKTEAPVTSTPLVEAGVGYFGSNDGHVYALNLRAPGVLWKAVTKDWVNSSAATADGVIYIGSNDRHVYAIDAATGEGNWTFATAGPAIARPAVYQNLVIAAGGSGDGAVYAVQVADGAAFWKYQTNGKIESDPVLAGDRLYVTSTDHHLYAFRIVRTIPPE